MSSSQPISYISGMSSSSSAEYSPFSFRDIERLESVFSNQEQEETADYSDMPFSQESFISSTFLPYPYTLAASPLHSRPHHTTFDEHDISTSWCDKRTDMLTHPCRDDSHHPPLSLDRGQERRRMECFFNVSLGSSYNHPSQSQPQETAINAYNKCDEERSLSIEEEHRPMTAAAAAAVEACNFEISQCLHIAETRLIGLQKYTTIDAPNDRFFWSKVHAVAGSPVGSSLMDNSLPPPPSSPPPPPPHAVDDCSKSHPLIQATAGGHRDIVKSLLSRGRDNDVNVVDQGGRTALLIASALGYIDIISLLMSKGANINAQSNLGISSLMVAVRSGCLDTVCTLLGYHSLDLTIAETSCGYTALILAITTSSQDDIIEALIHRHRHHHHHHDNKSSDLNVQDFNGHTALMHAAIRGKPDIASLLLRQGAACDVQDFDGKTALHHAAERGCLTLVMELLDHQADPNKQDHKGYTPLMYSLENDQVLTSYRLLQGPHHIDLLPMSKNGRSALAIAAEKRQRHIFAELLRRSIPLDSNIFRKAQALLLE